MTDSDQWWYGKGGDKEGPLSLEGLVEALGPQGIPPDTQVWNSDLGEWTPARDVPRLHPHLVPPKSVPNEPNEVVMEAHGKQKATLQLLRNPNRVRIKRKGLLSTMSHGVKGDKEILISRLASLQFKPAGKLGTGYLQLGFSGGSEDKGGIFDAAKDENTVLFTQKQQPQFEAIKSRIEQLMDESSRPQVVQQAPAESKAQEIKNLAELRDEGVLSEEEFSAAKKKILGIT